MKDEELQCKDIVEINMRGKVKARLLDTFSGGNITEVTVEIPVPGKEKPILLVLPPELVKKVKNT